MPDPSPPTAANAPGSPEAPALPINRISQALGNPLRWAILRELATGEPLMAVEIARKVGRPAPLVSKHLAVLRKAGLVVIKQQLQVIPARFIPEPGRRVLDLGHCLLRLDADSVESAAR